ncbi:pectinesterase precursor [Aspergillus flavus]|uniref:Pectinesterase n=1 Tax=Aspergillus flavus TaxID=5059 RepID=A0AB74CRN8_ASPFL|nr:pectinesterase precursor [Aspergillus flavus]
MTDTGSVVGAVDYIFGDAAAWFGECEEDTSPPVREPTARTKHSMLLITAWYVQNKFFDNRIPVGPLLKNSQITAAAGASVDGKVFLGRPWRPLARVIYQYSTLTGVVHLEGWAPMAEGATPIFMEYENTGAGSNTSVGLYETPASAAMAKSQLWGGDAGWYDKAY